MFHKAVKTSFGLLALASLTLNSAAAATVSINPQLGDIIANLRTDTSAALIPIPYTGSKSNAKRFAEGLPPLPPYTRRTYRKHPERSDLLQAGRKRENAPSSLPTLHVTGTIYVTNADSNTGMGYLSSQLNIFGEYHTVVSSPADANAVRVTLPSDVLINGGEFENLALTAADGFPLLGGTQGYANNGEDLKSTTDNYAFFTNVNESPAHTTGNKVGNSFTTAVAIREPSQSVIWTYNPVTRALSITWTNTDGSTLVPVALNSPGNCYLWTGDMSAFENSFSGTNALAYTFVPDV